MSLLAVSASISAACGTVKANEPQITSTAPTVAASTERSEPTSATTSSTAAPTSTTTTWGIRPDRILVGPGGLQVDLSACPAGWRDDTGVAPDRIALGSSAPLAGPLAAISSSVKGVQGRFAQVNAAGGIAGRQLDLTLIDDDGWKPERSAANARTLIDTGILALVDVFGSKQSEAVSSVASPACVPQFAGTPHPVFNNPASRPWVVPALSSWMAEVTALLQTISAEQPGGVTLAVVSDDDREYGDSLVRYVTAVAAIFPQVSVLPAVRVPLGTTDAGAVAAQVVAGRPSAIIVGTISAITESLLRSLQASDAAPSARFVTSSVVLQRVVAAGAEGWRSIRHSDPPEQAAGSMAAGYLEAAGAAGIGPTDRAGFWSGYAQGELFVQALRAAAGMPGGVNRSNLLLALWSMNTTHPAMPGLRVHANGPADPSLIEGGVLERMTNGVFVPLGIVDVDGRTPRCATLDLLSC